LKRRLLLIGAGGHCHSCIEAIESTQRFQIHGIIGIAKEVGRSVLGYDIIGTDDDLPSVMQDCKQAMVTLGQIKSAAKRMEMYSRLSQLGAETPSIIASSAVVSRHATVGPGTIVMHGAIINAGADVGSNVIVNSSALIEHDARVGDHCHISTAATVNGSVSIGDETFIGSNSVIHQTVRVGRRVVVGAGSNIASDVEDGMTIRVKSDSPAIKANNERL